MPKLAYPTRDEGADLRYRHIYPFFLEVAVLCDNIPQEIHALQAHLSPLIISTINLPKSVNSAEEPFPKEIRFNSLRILELNFNVDKEILLDSDILFNKFVIAR